MSGDPWAAWRAGRERKAAGQELERSSFWRRRSAEVIASVIAERPGLDFPELRRAISAAYPFGPREHWPYKVWLAEVRRALREEARRREVAGEKGRGNGMV